MSISRNLPRLPSLLLGVGLLLSAGAASAACTANIEGVGATPVVQYSPYGGAIATANLTVRLLVDNGGTAGSCMLGLAAFDNNPGSARYMGSGTNQILYRLYSASGAELINSPDGIVA